MNYAKWDAFVDSDDDGSSSKNQVVKKQATAIDPAAAAETAFLLQADLENFEAEVSTVEPKSAFPACEPSFGSDNPEKCPLPASALEFGSKAVPSHWAKARRPTVLKNSSEDEAKCDAPVAGDAENLPPRPHSDGGALDGEATAQATRRKNMDRTWEVMEEKDFEASHGPNSQPPEWAQRGAAIAAELRGAADAPDPPGAQKGGASSSTTSPSLAEPELKCSSLKRVKQMDSGVVQAIECECGVNVSKSDVFRLVLPNRGSTLNKQTRVLIVTLGESFLCEEPITEEEETAPENTCSHTAGPADAPVGTSIGYDDDGKCPPSSDTPKAIESEGGERVVSEVAQEADTGGTLGGGEDDRSGADADNSAGTNVCTSAAEKHLPPSTEELGTETHCVGTAYVELRFFRAAPKTQALARRLGKVPALHLTIRTDGHLCHSMEFIGVHQRRYCVEENPGDAISRNLTESLLKVALEFVFHPSRTRYAQERLVLRECSTSTDVQRECANALKSMAEQVKEANSAIKEVLIEFSEERARGAPARGDKDKSFMIFDEDVLKVAPAKSSLPSKRPPAAGSFKGLSRGFLDKTSKKESKRNKPTDDSAPAATDTSAPDSTSHAAGAAEPANWPPQPPPVSSSAEEKQQLLLAAANVQWKVAEEVREFSKNHGVATNATSSGSGTAACNDSQARSAQTAGVEEEVEEDLDVDVDPPSLAELANQLFGEAAAQATAEEEAGQDAVGTPERAGPLEEELAHTDSTKTPSPKASSRGERAPSERSERSDLVLEESGGGLGTGDGFAEDTGRLSPGAAGMRGLLQQRRKEREEAAGSSVAAAPPQASPGTSDETDDLVSLWMKQRW